jgi:hypothetical protein
MPLNQLKTARYPDSGELVGIPYVDCVAAAFQVGAGPGTTDVVFTLPAAAGATDVPPALVVPAAAVQGDVIVSVIRIDAMAFDANIAICAAWVSLAGGPGVGQITVRFANPTGAAIPAVAAARTIRAYILR